MMKILDTTLREGEQTPNVSFSINEKIELAKMLDEFGVEMIEVGHPSVSNSVYESIKKISRENLSAELVAHVRALKNDIDTALTLDIDRIAIFLATSSLHIKDKLRTSSDKILEQITNSVQYAKDHGIKVRFTPEDGTRTDSKFLLAACNAALNAGADRISIADTVGIALPTQFAKIIQILKNCFNLDIDVHCHNDFGLALANALAAINAGADCVHATVNGIGERCGIVDLASLSLTATQLLNINKNYKLDMLKELSEFVEKASGIYLSPHSPVTGIHAFTHKSGVHTDGVIKNPDTYEPYPPELVGQTRHICIDKYTGKLAVQQKLEEFGITVDSDKLLKIVYKIKELGDSQRIIHDADILEIYEEVTGKNGVIIPKAIEAVVNLHLQSNIYTSNIVRKVNSIKGVEWIYELAGDEDINVHISVPNVPKLNHLIEEIRNISGIASTNTKIILKRFGGLNGNIS